jgi:hypothetical protein
MTNNNSEPPDISPIEGKFREMIDDTMQPEDKDLARKLLHLAMNFKKKEVGDAIKKAMEEIE